MIAQREVPRFQWRTHTKNNSVVKIALSRRNDTPVAEAISTLLNHFWYPAARNEFLLLANMLKSVAYQ